MLLLNKIQATYVEIMCTISEAIKYFIKSLVYFIDIYVMPNIHVKPLAYKYITYYTNIIYPFEYCHVILFREN